MVAGLIALIILGLIASVIGYCIEKKQFNRGICPKCRHRFHYFDSDSQGGRGYICKRCKNVVWVSWPGVDKIPVGKVYY